MKIGFIGAGRMGTSLGCLFHKHNFSIAGYYDILPKAAQAAAELTQSKFFQQLCDLAMETDLIFITTPDRAITEACQKLAECNTLSRGTIIAHTSGLADSTLLQIAKDKGCHIMSFHPLQSVTGNMAGAANLQLAHFTLEGDEPALLLGENILDQCQVSHIRIATEFKAAYHAAACIASNYCVTLIDQAVELMAAAGFKPSQASNMLMPLIQGTLTNITQHGTVDALTGPICRGDTQTIACHLQAINDILPKAEKFYRQMGLYTQEMLTRNGRPIVKEINKILED